MIEKYINLKVKALRGVSPKKKIRRNSSIIPPKRNRAFLMREHIEHPSQTFDTITVTPHVASRILYFLNQAQDVNAIVNYELHNNPASKGKGYSIGEKVAQRILDKRNSILPFQQFTNLSQLEAVEGLGKDKIQDLIYTFSEPVSQFSMINLISDTITKPTPPMLQAMMEASVGDDVFKEDPTVNALEAKVAQLFGKSAALFCPSGTMTNQIAIKVHTNPLDEVICDENSHIYQYETGGFAFHSGVSIQLIKGNFGKITATQVEAAIKPVYDWLPTSKLVVLENTCNKGGGSYYTLEEIQPIHQLCQAKGLKLHLDGARIFNALVETNESTLAVGALFDSISICLSKGLGAPIGSLLIGDQDFIAQARRFRKVMGGGMRQAGYLAAAGIYALEHHVERLKTDNDRAKQIGAVLATLPFVEHIRPIATNIIIFDVKPPFTASSFLALLKENNVLAVAFGPQTIRFVTHLDFTESMLAQLLDVLKKLAV